MHPADSWKTCSISAFQAHFRLKTRLIHKSFPPQTAVTNHTAIYTLLDFLISCRIIPILVLFCQSSVLVSTGSLQCFACWWGDSMVIWPWQKPATIILPQVLFTISGVIPEKNASSTKTKHEHVYTGYHKSVWQRIPNTTWFIFTGYIPAGAGTDPLRGTSRQPCSTHPSHILHANGRKQDVSDTTTWTLI